MPLPCLLLFLSENQKNQISLHFNLNFTWKAHLGDLETHSKIVPVSRRKTQLQLLHSHHCLNHAPHFAANWFHKVF